MSYHIYTTNGIILKQTPFGEANVLLHILTEDLGLIMASAHAVRTPASKLRSALQEYTFVSISCIKGKNGYKVTNVLEKNNFFFEMGDEMSKIPFDIKEDDVARTVLARRVIAQIVSVIMKMIPGESPHPEIFQTVLTGFEYLVKLSEMARTVLSTKPDESISNIANFEILAVLRILYHLGYVVSDTHTKEFLDNPNEWSANLLNQISVQKREVVALINKALQASQL